MAKVIVLGEDDDDETSGDTQSNGRTQYHKTCKCTKGAGKCGQGFYTYNSRDRICSACIIDIHNH